jgi:hypothetical protein
MAEMDFPPGPILGQKYTAPSGIVYEWDGYGWIVGFYNTADQDFTVVGDLLDQIRTLLQDTDARSGEYRYSTDSIIMNLNQGLMEMFRLRPDLFLENNYVVPVWSVGEPDVAVLIEPQYVPALVYYAVGMTQARDDEQTQDQRATGFIRIFQSALITGGVVTL